MFTNPESREASRKRVNEAGGSRPPAGVAGRWPLHVRALLSPSLEWWGSTWNSRPEEEWM